MRPEISIIVPTLNRPHELRLCLEGFVAQTVAGHRFEVIVVDDGSELDIESVARAFGDRLAIRYERRGHAGISASRNHGIDVAAAPLLVLYDDDLQPSTDFVAFCLSFHSENPAVADTALLGFALDRRFSSPLTEWIFSRIYCFPEDSGWRSWAAFWGGTITCKKALFDVARFDPAWLSAEDAEFATRCSRATPLRVFYAAQPLGILTRPIRLSSLRRREYMRAYYEYRLKESYPEFWPFAYSPYLDPEPFILADRRRADVMAATADAMERQLADRSPSRRERLLLYHMWEVLRYDSLAGGWIAARDGRSPEVA